jgi:hypothetical protein
MNREHGYRDVEVWVFVINGGEAGTQHATHDTRYAARLHASANKFQPT